MAQEPPAQLGSSYVGTDLNRNYGYKWGCCGGSSGFPSSDTYRGPSAFSAPETQRIRDFINSRVIGGKQQIKTSITFHSYAQLVLWPYGYTYTDVPSDMTQDDHDVFAAMGQSMAATNGYTPQQASDLYITDGTTDDWAYGVHKIFMYTFEMGSNTFYPPGSEIAALTSVNDAAVRYIMQQADCPYRTIGKEAQYCCTTPPMPRPTWQRPPPPSARSTCPGLTTPVARQGSRSSAARARLHRLRPDRHGRRERDQLYQYRAGCLHQLQLPCAGVQQGRRFGLLQRRQRDDTGYPSIAAAPTNLVAMAVSTSQINLTWTDNATNETGFKIERCKGATCTNFAQIATVGANATSYRNTRLDREHHLPLPRASLQRERQFGLFQHCERHHLQAVTGKRRQGLGNAANGAIDRRCQLE